MRTHPVVQQIQLWPIESAFHVKAVNCWLK